jgi:SAM-dependent methyltransferase
MSPTAISDYEYLQRHRAIWQQKPILRRIYKEQYYSRLLHHCAPGEAIVELGSGPGLLGEFAPHIWRTDILPSPWIHCAADAHHLPFADAAFDNVVGLDVLHHFNHPVAVLREAARVLRPGGRLVLVEPWITPFSRLIYTYFHQEECDLNARPWLEVDNQFDTAKNAFDGNAAIPYLLLRRGRETLAKLLPEFRLLILVRFSFLTYLLSFGFKPRNIFPEPFYRPLYSLEEATCSLWATVAALRALIVWEKQG